MTTWAITELGPGDWQAVADAGHLTDAILGRGAFTVEQVLEDLRNGNLLFLTANAGKPPVLVGVATARVLDDDGYREFIAPMPPGTLPAALPSASGRRIGRLHTSAVTAAMRGRGLGSALAAHRTEWLRERCSEAYAISWLHNRQGRSEGLLRALGWQPVTILHDYWLQVTTTGDQSCPQCGCLCHCPGLLLRLPIPELGHPPGQLAKWSEWSEWSERISYLPV
ncbi:GNAT family N-acetyltransferase [Streptomyces klenkii]|uniref:GNAT family N-acetyltransferase n=1 Tax=Streptomyces klenkii TaxID=1420899 RepID=UPI0033B62CA5